MPNLLSIPFKKTWATTSITDSARNFLLHQSSEHPDAFKWDINRWETLRKDGVGGVTHVNQIDAGLKYHAQLVFILTKLPSSLNVETKYAPAFASSAIPIELQNLAYERVCVLFNIAALYSQLGAAEDRSGEQGLKRAKSYFQLAAGTFQYMAQSVLPSFAYPQDGEDVPWDLTEPFIKSLEFLMLAQAQECAWQKAVMDHLRNGTIAKLSFQCAEYYNSSRVAILDAHPSVKQSFPSDWIAHLETKALHFEAAAHYRKSLEDGENSRYGQELARLHEAADKAKKGYNTARRGGIADAVLKDIKSLQDTVQTAVTNAERDNDLIYHQDVPAASALAPIVGAVMALSSVPPQLSDPKTALGADATIFGELLGWGAREAINIYNNNKETLIQERVIEVSDDLNVTADELLQELNLPSALEALEKPIGLPPSLLKKAEEVRLDDGPRMIDAWIEDIDRLAERNNALLDQAFDLLDSETSEDEAARKEHPLDRPPSREANREIVTKGQRYRQVIDQARASDELVRQKWDEWEEAITRLTLPEDELERTVPSSTASSSSSSATQRHAHDLRRSLESLDDLKVARARIVERVRILSDADDIQPRIMKVASGIERWVEVKPVMFSDVSDEELIKYDKFIAEMATNQRSQQSVLEDIKRNNTLFLQSRKEDPSRNLREKELQVLDVAYQKYREITRNLDEGLQFYNDLASLLTQYKDSCKSWTLSRKLELHTLLTPAPPSQPARPSTAREDQKAARNVPKTLAVAPPPPTFASKQKAATKDALALPSLDSDDWKPLELPPGPPQNIPVAKGARRTPAKMT